MMSVYSISDFFSYTSATIHIGVALQEMSVINLAGGHLLVVNKRVPEKFKICKTHCMAILNNRNHNCLEGTYASGEIPRKLEKNDLKYNRVKRINDLYQKLVSIGVDNLNWKFVNCEACVNDTENSSFSCCCDMLAEKIQENEFHTLVYPNIRAQHNLPAIFYTNRPIDLDYEEIFIDVNNMIKLKDLVVVKLFSDFKFYNFVGFVVLQKTLFELSGDQAGIVIMSNTIRFTEKEIYETLESTSVEMSWENANKYPMYGIGNLDLDDLEHCKAKYCDYLVTDSTFYFYK